MAPKRAPEGGASGGGGARPKRAKTSAAAPAAKEEAAAAAKSAAAAVPRATFPGWSRPHPDECRVRAARAAARRCSALRAWELPLRLPRLQLAPRSALPPRLQAVTAALAALHGVPRREGRHEDPSDDG
jgi:hypothetical protein